MNSQETGYMMGFLPWAYNYIVQKFMVSTYIFVGLPLGGLGSYLVTHLATLSVQLAYHRLLSCLYPTLDPGARSLLCETSTEPVSCLCYCTEQSVQR